MCSTNQWPLVVIRWWALATCSQIYDRCAYVNWPNSLNFAPKSFQNHKRDLFCRPIDHRGAFWSLLGPYQINTHGASCLLRNERESSVSGVAIVIIHLCHHLQVYIWYISTLGTCTNDHAWVHMICPWWDEDIYEYSPISPSNLSFKNNLDLENHTT